MARAETPRLALLADASVGHARQWALGLGERAFAVRLFSLEKLREAAGPPLDFRRLGAPPLPGAFRYPLALPALRRALAEFRPHLVDAHFLPSYGLLGVLSGRRPLVVNSWGSDLLLAGGPWRRARVRYVLARADRVIVDAATSERAALALGAAPERLVRLPWGVEARSFPDGGDAAARRRRRQGWPPSWRERGDDAELVIVSTRHLHPVYDVATLVRAWPAIRAMHATALCLVAGEGPQAAALCDLARRLGCEASLRFLGRLAGEEMAELLAGADLYVSTSLSDTTSISLLEAMSAGAIPVVSDLEANREWVEARSAELFRPGSPEELAASVARAWARRSTWDEMRRVLRQRVLADGDRRAALDRVATLYRELLGSV